MKAWICTKLTCYMRFRAVIDGILICRQALRDFKYLTAQQISNYSLRVSSAFFHFSIIIANVKTGSPSVALFGLPGKLSEFNNIRSLTGTLHVTSLTFQIPLNCSSPNFDILEISSYTILLKVDFSLLSTVSLLNLNGFVTIDVFNLKILDW